MTDARWQQVKALFEAAVERPPVERAAFLAAATGGDDALRREIESLLDSASSDPGFTDRLAALRSDSISRRNASSPPVAAARNAPRSAGGRSTAASNNALTCCQRASVMADAPLRVHATAMPWPCATRASPSTPTPSTQVPLLRW